MEEQTNQIKSYLVFKVGDEEYAVNAGKIQRILEMQPITSIPRAPKYVKGVINLMGQVLPIIDTRIKMDMEPKEYDASTCIVIIEISKGDTMIETGIVVDSVLNVIEVEKDDIRNSPQFGFDTEVNYIAGMIERDNKFIVVLDTDNIFSTAEVVSINNIADSGFGLPKEAAE